MYNFTWSEHATHDYEDLLQYIHRDNPVNARMVANRILKTLGMLESFSLGQSIGENACRLYIPKTPYFVIFRRADNGEISIRAFIHAARDWSQFDWRAF